MRSVVLRSKMSASGLGSVLTACIRGLSGSGFRPKNGWLRKTRPGRIKKLEAELRLVTDERDIKKSRGVLGEAARVSYAFN